MRRVTRRGDGKGPTLHTWTDDEQVVERATAEPGEKRDTPTKKRSAAKKAKK